MCVGCAVGGAESPRPRTDGPACVESFGAVLEGWEALVGSVPEDCAHLDETYNLQLMSDQMPCTGDVSGRVVGCSISPPGPRNEGDMFVNAHDTDETQRVDISVHEWVHALAYCVRGSGDPGHDDVTLWGEHPHGRAIELDPHDVKAYGLVTSALGSCIIGQ
jgi:hypothetical protein